MCAGFMLEPPASYQPLAFSPLSLTHTHTHRLRPGAAQGVTWAATESPFPSLSGLVPRAPPVRSKCRCDRSPRSCESQRPLSQILRRMSAQGLPGVRSAPRGGTSAHHPRWPYQICQQCHATSQRSMRDQAAAHSAATMGAVRRRQRRQRRREAARTWAQRRT
jgi:hypothetical protein